MDGAVARLYRRLGRFYPLAFVAFAVMEAYLFQLIVVYVAVVRYLGFSHAVFWHIERYTLVGIEAGTLVGFAGIAHRSRPVIRWISGHRAVEDAASAWRNAIRMPSLHWSTAAPPIIVGALPALAIINAVAHPAIAQLAAITFGSVVVIVLAILLHQVATETLLRPVLSEIDTVSPQAGLDPGAGSRSIRFRIVASSLLVVWASAWLVSGLVTRTTNPVSQMSLTIIGGLGVALTFGLVLTLGLSQSLFGPLHELRDATKRVQQGDLTTRLKLVSNDEIGEVAASFNDMVAGLAERAALHAALGTYLDPSVADRLLREGQFLKGEAVDATILFCDIIGFTTRAERMRPEEVVAELNEFFDIVIPVIEKHGGHTNKLLGDGFMAVFGAPVPLDDHADRAVAAACEIQENIWQHYGGEVRAGIGMNSGTAIVGTTGGGRKLDFTVIGDTVNVASRVEALTRTTGDTILLTEATKQALRRAEPLDPRGSVEIRGREELTPLYSVIVRARG